jgi:hypothetical protein
VYVAMAPRQAYYMGWTAVSNGACVPIKTCRVEFVASRHGQEVVRGPIMVRNLKLSWLVRGKRVGFMPSVSWELLGVVLKEEAQGMEDTWNRQAWLLGGYVEDDDILWFGHSERY